MFENCSIIAEMDFAAQRAGTKARHMGIAQFNGSMAWMGEVLVPWQGGRARFGTPQVYSFGADASLGSSVAFSSGSFFVR